MKNRGLSRSVVSLLLTILLSWTEQCASWAPHRRYWPGMSGVPRAWLLDGQHSISGTCAVRLPGRRHCTIQLNSLFEYFDEAESVNSDEDDDEFSDDELMSAAGDFDERIPRMNTVHLTGRVGNVPEPRYFDDGKVVVNLSLACKRKYHWEDRESNDVAWGEEETDWYNLEIWSGLAEFVSKYVDKGARVGVIGALQEDEFPDRETGEARSRVKIIVRDLDLLETKAEADLRRSNKGRSGGQFFSPGKQQDDAGWQSQDFF